MERLYQLSRDLYEAEEAILEFSEYNKDILLISLEKYMPQKFTFKASIRENLSQSLLFSGFNVPVQVLRCISQNLFDLPRMRLFSKCTFVPRLFRESLYT